MFNNVMYKLKSVYLSDEDKYMKLPEMCKFMIANPYIMIKYPKFRQKLLDKCDEIQKELHNKLHIEDAYSNNVYVINDGYRRELSALLRITKSIAIIYERLNINDESFYENIEEIATMFENAL